MLSAQRFGQPIRERQLPVKVTVNLCNFKHRLAFAFLNQREKKIVDGLQQVEKYPFCGCKSVDLLLNFMTLCKFWETFDWCKLKISYFLIFDWQKTRHLHPGDIISTRQKKTMHMFLLEIRKDFPRISVRMIFFGRLDQCYARLRPLDCKQN